MNVNMELLQRVKEALSGQGIVEKEMFGGGRTFLSSAPSGNPGKVLTL